LLERDESRGPKSDSEDRVCCKNGTFTVTIWVAASACTKGFGHAGIRIAGIEADGKRRSLEEKSSKPLQNGMNYTPWEQGKNGKQCRKKINRGTEARFVKIKKVVG